MFFQETENIFPCFSVCQLKMLWSKGNKSGNIFQLLTQLFFQFKNIDRNGNLQSTGFHLLPEPGVALFHENICSPILPPIFFSTSVIKNKVEETVPTSPFLPSHALQEHMLGIYYLLFHQQTNQPKHNVETMPYRSWFNLSWHWI